MFHLADVLAQERGTLPAPQAGWTVDAALQRVRNRKVPVMPETAPAFHLPRRDEDLESLAAQLHAVEAEFGATGVEAVVACVDAPVVATASSPDADGQRRFSLVSVLAPANGQRTLVAGIFAAGLTRRRGKPMVLRACQVAAVGADVEDDVRALLERAYSRSDQPHRLISARGRDRAPRLGWYGLPRDERNLPAEWVSRLAAAAAVEGYELFLPVNPHDDARRAVHEITDVSPEVVAVWHAHAPAMGIWELSTTPRVPILDIVADDADAAMESLRDQLAAYPVVVRPDESGPEDVAAALKQARNGCQNVVILDQASRSAAASPFERPQQVLDGLLAIDAVAGRYGAEGLGAGGFEAAFAAEGQNYAGGISQTARTQYRSYYEITYEGATVMMGPHLRFGSSWSPAYCARVYWHLDTQRRKLIIGHIGKHLPGATD